MWTRGPVKFQGITGTQFFQQARRFLEVLVGKVKYGNKAAMWGEIPTGNARDMDVDTLIGARGAQILSGRNIYSIYVSQLWFFSTAMSPLKKTHPCSYKLDQIRWFSQTSTMPSWCHSFNSSFSQPFPAMHCEKFIKTFWWGLTDTNLHKLNLSGNSAHSDMEH